ncbi:MAG: ABC transporter ATP-binding protein [Eubacteriales bacterium]
MKNYFKKTLGLSDQGATDIIRANSAATFVNLFLMATSGVLYSFLKDSLTSSLNGERPSFDLLFYILYSLIIVVCIYISYYFAYNTSYMSAYNESATKRITLAETLRKLPLSFFGKKDLSDITTTIMTDAAELEHSFSHFIPVLVGSITSTTIISIGLLVFNVKMAIATLWVIPISFALCVMTRAYQRKFNVKSVGNRLDYDNKLTECIENIKDMKANNRKEAHQEDLERKLKSSERHNLITELGIGLPVCTAQMILKVGIATSMLMGVNLLGKEEIDLLTFLVFMVLVTRVFDPIAGALINLAATFHSLVSIDRMKDLEATKLQTGKEHFAPKGYDIVFDQVTFAYHDGETVINNASFIAKQGEITALVGPSGGGKSTALKLVARFWDVTKGSIRIGGENISEIDPETLLKSISIVFQDVTLFDNTILENIRIGKIGATDEEVMEAAKAAHCHEFVEKLSNGYHTFIGENGATLSGGERQRLSIARALLKDAPIVLLDEATSSLDIQSETAVQSAINRLTKEKTVIVIAHRMRTIAGANKIILLKEGKVAEEGTHNELMKHGANYANMVNLQVKSMNWKLV